METRAGASVRSAVALAALLIAAATVLFVAGLPTAPPPHARPQAAKIAVRVRVANRSELSRLLAGAFDVATVTSPAGNGREGEAELLVTQADLLRLAALHFEVETIPPAPRSASLKKDRQRRSATPPAKSATASFPPNFGKGAIAGYYSYAEILSLLDLYAATYPQIVSPKFAIGTSVEGRPIYAIKVSDDWQVSEQEPRVLIDALHHSREPTSMQTLLLALHRLVTGYGTDPTLTGLVDGREIFFVPCVNPDGYVYNETTNPSGGGLWRKNRRVSPGGCAGVDLNRNYAYQWGCDDIGSSADPCAESYRGAAPLSEPETQAIESLEAQEQFALAVSLHAHGRQMLFPFGFQWAEPSNSGDLAAYRAHGDEMASLNGYLFGPICDVVGSANGNYVDQFHAVHHAEAWAFEVGSAFWPGVPEMIDVAEKNVAPLLRLVAYAGSDVEPSTLVVTEVAGNANGFPDPGETIEPRVVVTNLGRNDGAQTIGVDVTSLDPAAIVTSGHATAAPLAAGVSTTIGAGQLRVLLSPSIAPGSAVTLIVRVGFDGRFVEHALSFVAGTRRRLAHDDAENDLGFRLGLATDTAMTGRWTRGDPIGIAQGFSDAQPEDDVTENGGVRCFLTGNAGTAPGQDDVDDGFTTLLSPVFDLSAAVRPRLRLERFYWCSKADSPLRFELSNDGGQSFTVLDEIDGRPNSWRDSDWPLEDFLPLTDRMQLRVVAQDLQNTSVVEAAIDEIEISDFSKLPHVLVFGRPRIGGLVDVCLAAEKNTTFWLLGGTKPSTSKVPGIAGLLGIDASTLMLLSTLTIPAAGFAHTVVAIPRDPALVGAVVYLQGIAGGAQLTAGNTTKVTIE